MLLENNYILLFFLFSLTIAITAFVYSYILTQPGEFFSKPYFKLDVLFKTDYRAAQGLDKHPLFKLLMACEKCVAGQMALWIFLVINFQYYLNGAFVLIIPHLLFVGTSIFFTLLIKAFYLKHIESLWK